MDNKELASIVLEKVGGAGNVEHLTHCVTRLRFVLRNNEAADTAAIEALDDVLGVKLQGGQYQVIVGTRVNGVHRELLSIAPNLGSESGAPSRGEGEKQSVVNRLISTLSGILIPALPPIIGGGIIKGIIYMFWGFGMLPMESPLFNLLNIVSDCMFYYFPFLLAVSSAERFRTDKYMAIALAGALMYKSILAAVGAGEEALTVGFLSIPYMDYSQTVIPIIINVWLLSYVYRFFEDHLPEMVKIVFTPVLTLLVMVPVELAFIAPIGFMVGDGLAQGFTVLFNTVPIVGGFLLGALRPILVLGGMHHAMLSVGAQLIATYGYDLTGPADFVSTLCQAVAPLAVYFVLRDHDAKAAKMSFSTWVSGFFGVTEPALYGILVKYKVAMAAVILGGGVGGAITAAFGSRIYGIVMPSFLTIPSLFGEGMMGAVIGIPVALAITFFGILAFRGSILKESGVQKDVTPNADAEAAAAQENPSSGSVLAVASPVSGSMNPAQSGDDSAVELGPVSGLVAAPVGGVVVQSTGRKVVLEGERGLRVFVECVDDASGFEQRAEMGAKLGAGDQLASMAEGAQGRIIVGVENPNDFLDVFPSTQLASPHVGETILRVVAS